jgi:predicted dehydrogenase
MRSARIAVVGLGHGLHLARWAMRVGLDVVGACDRDPSRLDTPVGIRIRTARWQDLLDLDIDGVILADDFDTHAPLAVVFLDHGVHVLSETAACTREDEGRRLIDAADASTATYSFAENYVAPPHVGLIREIVDRGDIGRIELIEADYLHGVSPDALTVLLGPADHWRNRIAPTAYCTHTVSPILAVSGARPAEVCAHPVFASERPMAVVLVIRLSTGAAGGRRLVGRHRRGGVAGTRIHPAPRPAARLNVTRLHLRVISIIDGTRPSVDARGALPWPPERVDAAYDKQWIRLQRIR